MIITQLAYRIDIIMKRSSFLKHIIVIQIFLLCAFLHHKSYLMAFIIKSILGIY